MMIISLMQTSRSVPIWASVIGSQESVNVILAILGLLARDCYVLLEQTPEMPLYHAVVMVFVCLVEIVSN